MAERFDPQALMDVTGMGVRPLSRRLGVDAAILCRSWSPWQADAYAVRCGWLPSEVWGDAWYPEAAGDDEGDWDEMPPEVAADLRARLGLPDPQQDHQRQEPTTADQGGWGAKLDGEIPQLVRL